ncbi:MAG: class I SAM-dependent methyltransferase [Desulfovibrio sp.]|nr:class I SAM-dependent methyltransferase [Desulfovibrio sp.]
MNQSATRINRLAKRLPAKTYLEIGVFKGETFVDVAIPEKTAVDPAFNFDVSVYKNDKNIRALEVTSSDFFKTLREEKAKTGISPLYDIIFLDGLHTFRQTFHDFLDTMPYSHPETIWIFDDTAPYDPFCAIPNQRISYRYRAAFGIGGKPWHGDVFKCVFAIHDFYPFFSYATVYGVGNPQTVVWRTQKASDRVRLFGDMEQISRLTYFDLLGRLDALHPVKDEELDAKIGEIFVKAAQPAEQFLKNFIVPFRK